MRFMIEDVVSQYRNFCSVEDETSAKKLLQYRGRGFAQYRGRIWFANTVLIGSIDNAVDAFLIIGGRALIIPSCRCEPDARPLYSCVAALTQRGTCSNTCSKVRRMLRFVRTSRSMDKVEPAHQ